MIKKIILLPATGFLWFLSTWICAYIIFFESAFIFSIGWPWLIIAFFLVVILSFGIAFLLFAFLGKLLIKIYETTFTMYVIHSLVGLITAIQIIRFFYLNPIEVGNTGGDASVFALTFMWGVAPIKTILTLGFFMFLGLGWLYFSIIFPIYLWLKEDYDKGLLNFAKENSWDSEGIDEDENLP